MSVHVVVVLGLVLTLSSGYAASRRVKTSITGGCKTNVDCELLGICTTGKCICEPGFTGETCGQLNLKPIESNTSGRVWPLQDTSPDTASWGFSAVKGDDGMYHGVVNVGCGTTATSVTGTYAALVTSSQPNAKFKFQEMITPPTSFNPHMIRSPNGTYLLFFRVNDLDNHSICTGDPSVKTPPTPQIKPCTSNQHPATDECVIPGSPDGLGINMYVAWAESVTGPWKSTSVEITGCGNYHKSNPTTAYLKDGRIMMSYRFNSDHGEMVAFAVADDFRGPFKSIANLTHHGGNDEDSYLWQQPDGSLHILYHNGPNGLHAFSDNIGNNWTKGSDDAFVDSVPINGGGTLTFRRRERPEIYFENGRPLMFYTAVQKEDLTSMSFVQEFQ